MFTTHSGQNFSKFFKMNKNYLRASIRFYQLNGDDKNNVLAQSVTSYIEIAKQKRVNKGKYKLSDYNIPWVTNSITLLNKNDRNRCMIS